MDRGLAVVLTAVVGGLIALQAPINSTLGRAVGTWQAAAVSFGIGTLVLVAIVLLGAGGSATWAKRAISAGTTCSAGCWARPT